MTPFRRTVPLVVRPVFRLTVLVAPLVSLLVSLLVAGPVSLLVAPAAAGPARAAERPEGHWPLDPRPEVVRGFDPPTDPWAAGHRGVDLAGHPGQVVRTALAGTVSFAGSVAGKPVVTVSHGARRTTYEPVVATVTAGETVTAGQPIGRLAVLHGHCVPAACLHWGLRRGDTYLDPLSLVGGGPVRLLPLWRDDPVPTASRRWRPPLSWSRPPLSWWRPPIVGRRPPPDALPGRGRAGVSRGTATRRGPRLLVTADEPASPRGDHGHARGCACW